MMTSNNIISQLYDIFDGALFVRIEPGMHLAITWHGGSAIHLHTLNDSTLGVRVKHDVRYLSTEDPSAATYVDVVDYVSSLVETLNEH